MGDLYLDWSDQVSFCRAREREVVRDSLRAGSGRPGTEAPETPETTEAPEAPKAPKATVK